MFRQKTQQNISIALTSLRCDRTHFSLLDKESLWECLLVNKRFNQIISTSRKVMKRFTFHIDANSDRIRSSIWLTRCYPKLKISGLKQHQCENFASTFQFLGNGATDVRFEFSYLPTEQQLFNCFPNIVKLSIDRCARNLGSIDPSTFPKLKELHATSCVS